MNKEKRSKKEKIGKFSTVNIENNPSGLFPDINSNNNDSDLRNLRFWSKE